MNVRNVVLAEVAAPGTGDGDRSGHKSLTYRIVLRALCKMHGSNAPVIDRFCISSVQYHFFMELIAFLLCHDTNNCIHPL